MALRATPTIAICLTAGIAAGVALARPADEAPSNVAANASATNDTDEPAANDSPYLTSDESSATGTATEASAEPAGAAIPIEGFAFFPPDAVAPGTAVTVTNRDGAAHTLTAQDGEFDTGTLGPNETGLFVAPSAAGTYEFFCEIHPSMTATLLVG